MGSRSEVLIRRSAKQLDYDNLPLELSKHIYSSVRDGIIYYARLHYEGNAHLEVYIVKPES